MIAFWKFRVMGPASDPSLLTRTIDLYTEHIPMAHAGFGAWARGEIPLWNPDQLCGIPLLAVPHTGLLYPGNAPYLFTDAASATEWVYVLHLILAAAGVWALARCFGIGWIGCAAGAASYAWSGYLANNLHQAAILSGLAWLPATIFLIERALRGRPWGWTATALAVAFQILNGATEVVVYTLYAGGLFVLIRCISLGKTEGPARALRGAGSVLLAVIAGLGLSMVQFLPSLELVSQGARASQALGLADQLGPYGPTPLGFLLARLASEPVGMLALGLCLLGAALPRQRSLWAFAFLASLLGLTLSSGGALYQWYAETPIGSLFRYPHKFQQVSGLGLALLVATGMHTLTTYAASPQSHLWRNPWWLGNLLGASAVLGLLAQAGDGGATWLAPAAVLALFGAMPSKQVRYGIALATAGAFATTLFSTVENQRIRPSARPEAYDTNAALFEWLRAHSEGGRVYLSPRLRLIPGLTLKQGMLQQVPTVGDYEALATLRHAQYFTAAAGRRYEDTLVIGANPGHDQPSPAFAGYVLLGEGSDWRLLEMASTRYFITLSGDEVSRALARGLRGGQTPRATRVATPGTRVDPMPGRRVEVWEASRSLPRAYFVSHAITADGPAGALEIARSPAFDPYRSVVLEGHDGRLPVPTGQAAPGRPVTIVDDLPERVSLQVDVEEPGFLVLTDAWFPGWEVRVDGIPKPILRANHLFRAVALDPGASSVVFEYRPRSLRAGAAISAATALAIVLSLLFGRRKQRVDPPLP